MATTASVLTVSQLNRQVKSWLENEIGRVCVEGEISNLSKPTSGHYYFTLSDATAQVRSVYFKNRHQQQTADILKNGQKVLVQGEVSLYEARGDYQLIISQLEEAGAGDLHRQFELLKTKLAALGLFDASQKKPLPAYPLTIGVITSATGAAVHDILTTLARRFPIANILIYASDVQGQQAAPHLIRALQTAYLDRRADVLILARGGGSIEDLWAFNDEQLAYTIAQRTIPLVTGIGHETDVTIADFIADNRAATPTAAAETVSPNMTDMLSGLDAIHKRLYTAITRLLQHQRLQLHHELQKITSPKRLIHSHWQSVDYLRTHLQHAMRQCLMQKAALLQTNSTRLATRHPSTLIQQAKTQLQPLKNTLRQLIQGNIHHLKQQLTAQMATLHAVSPLATLDRGYAIATHHDKIITNGAHVALDDIVHIRLANGALIGKVIGKEP